MIPPLIPFVLYDDEPGVPAPVWIQPGAIVALLPHAQDPDAATIIETETCGYIVSGKMSTVALAVRRALLEPAPEVWPPEEARTPGLLNGTILEELGVRVAQIDAVAAKLEARVGALEDSRVEQSRALEDMNELVTQNATKTGPQVSPEGIRGLLMDHHRALEELAHYTRAAYLGENEEDLRPIVHEWPRLRLNLVELEGKPLWLGGNDRAELCADCGEPGQTTGHQECPSPRNR